MLKNYAPYTLKTIFSAILLCITLQSIYGQLNTAEFELVSDSTKVQANSLNKLNKAYQKIKIPLLKKENEKRFWALPSIAWNNYDKTQLGIMIGIEKKQKYQFLLMPMYGLGSGNLTGIINGDYQFSTPRIKHWDVGFKAKRFSYLLFPEDLSYNLIQPKLRITPQLAMDGNLGISIQSSYIWQEYIFNGRQTEAFNVHELGLDFRKKKKQYSYQTQVKLEFNKSYGLTKWTNKLKINYQKYNQNAAYVRGFIGSFLYNNTPNSQITPPLPIFQLGGMSNSGVFWLQKDYLFNDFYLDRNAQDNFLQKQVADSEGGFKSVMSTGNTNHFMAALNLKSDLLIPSRVKRWINMQLFANGAVSKNKNLKAAWYAEGGLSLLFLDEVIGFNIPFASTENIKLNQSTVYGIERRDWAKRISFSIDFMKLKSKLDIPK